LGNFTFALLLIALFALFKKAVAQSLCLLLFSKERLWDPSFSRSFQKSDCAIAIFFALFGKCKLAKSEKSVNF